MERKQYFNSTRIVMIALFGTLAGLLHIAKFPLSFAFASWLEFDLSDIALFIGTFALGSFSGSIIVVVKILVKLLCTGTSSMFVGDLANLLVGWAFVIPAGLLYRHHCTLKGALAALAVGSVSSVAVAMLANRFLLIPFYINVMFGGDWQPLLGMFSPLFPNVTRESFYNLYLWASVLPFNVLRCLVAGAVCFPVYKHISRLIERLNRKLAPKEEAGGKKRDLVLLLLGIGVALTVVLFVLLRFFLWD